MATQQQRAVSYPNPTPSYKRPQAEHYRLVLRSEDRDASSPPERPVFSIGWDRPLLKDVTYEAVLESFIPASFDEDDSDQVLEFNSPAPVEVRLLNSRSTYHSRDGIGGVLKIFTSWVYNSDGIPGSGVLLETPTNTLNTQLSFDIRFVYPQNGRVHPAIVSDPNNNYVIVLLVRPVQ